METITFEGPFHSSEIGKKIQLEKPGVYIWGLNVDSNTHTVIKNSSNKLGKFIPYYVGIASGKGKSKMTIKKRLLTHQKVDKGVGLKYTRINIQGIRDKYNNIESCISNIIKQKQNLVNRNKILSNVSYFNNDEVLKGLYPGICIKGTKGNFPITLQKINNTKDIKDTLKDYIDFGGFWFLFCSIDNENSLSENDFKHKLEIIESLTYYKLKGITISKVMNYNTIKNLDSTYNISCRIKIFKSSITTNFEGDKY
jgi:hypothetical protein